MTDETVYLGAEDENKPAPDPGNTDPSLLTEDLTPEELEEVKARLAADCGATAGTDEVQKEGDS